MAGGAGSNKSSTETNPWAKQQPYLEYLFGEGKRLYEGGGPQYYPGQTLAGQSPATGQAQENLWQTATGAGQQQANAAGQASLFGLTGAIDVNNNPFLQEAIKSAQRPLINQATDAGGVFSSIRSGAGADGQYGSSRQGLAEGLAYDRLNQQLGDISKTMSSEGYAQGLEAQGRALALMPSTMSTIAQPAGWMDSIGQQQWSWNQNLIDDAMMRYNYGQNAPYANLAQLQNYIQGSYGMSGQTQMPGPRNSPLLGGLGGASAGAGLAAAVGGPVGWGAGIGALLGLFGS